MAKKETVKIPLEFCITCGKEGDLVTYQFEYVQSALASKVANVLGIVVSGIDLVIGWLFNKRYVIYAGFCRKCGADLERLGRYNILFGLAAVALFICIGALGAFVSSITGSSRSGLAIFGFGFLAAFCVFIYSRFFIKKRSPRIKKIDKSNVFLNVPGRGQISVDRE